MNVGARKRRGCRDNMFVLSAVNNSVLNGTSEPIELQVKYIKTCFDKMWLQTSTNGLYECGLRNNLLQCFEICYTFWDNKRTVFVEI